MPFQNRETYLRSIFFAILFSQVFALGRNLPWSLLPESWGPWLGESVWGGITLGFFLFLIRGTRVLGQSQEIDPQSWLVTRGRGILQVLMVCSGAMVLVNHFYFRSFGYQFPMLIFPLCLTGLLCMRSQRPEWILGSSLGFSTAVLALSIIYFPLDPRRSDMLAVIQMAWNHWEAGLSPYSLVSGNRMPYLPTLWLSYFPAWWLSLDLRWATVAWRVLWGWMVIRALLRSNANQPSSALLQKPALWLVAGFWMTLPGASPGVSWS